MPKLDQPALQPLPAERYVMASWKTVRASIDYHVEVDRHYYSVPYQLAGQQLEARFTATTVEIFHRGKRVASHARSLRAYRHTTVSEHMPKSHQAHLEWTPSRLIHWAEGTVASHRPGGAHDSGKQASSGDGLSGLPGNHEPGKDLLPSRVWKPPVSAHVQLQACSYQSLKSILKRSLDRQTTLDAGA